MPEGTAGADSERERIDGMLALLHWVAGVSYFKAAVPGSRRASRRGRRTPPAAVAGLTRGAVLGGARGVRLRQRPARHLPRPRFASVAGRVRRG